MTNLVETDDGSVLSQGVYDTVVKLRRIADSFERDRMASSAGAMREAVAVIINLETQLRRRSPIARIEAFGGDVKQAPSAKPTKAG